MQSREQKAYYLAFVQLLTSHTCLLPCVVWVKRRDSVCHSTRRQPLLRVLRHAPFSNSPSWQCTIGATNRSTPKTAAMTSFVELLILRGLQSTYMNRAIGTKYSAGLGLRSRRAERPGHSRSLTQSSKLPHLIWPETEKVATRGATGHFTCAAVATGHKQYAGRPVKTSYLLQSNSTGWPPASSP